MEKIKIGLILAAIYFSSENLLAQNISCQTAVQQLHNYATQVNYSYHNEYVNFIPNVRCPATDAWGRYYPQNQVYLCRQNMYTNLNIWYSQQCYYVNNVYNQIVNACMTTQQDPIKLTPDNVPGTNENEGIQTDKIDDLAVGIDEDKAVKITIPSNPNGFTGN